MLSNYRIYSLEEILICYIKNNKELYAIDILNKIKDIDKIKDENNNTILHLACMYSMTKLIPELIKRNCNINSKNNNSITPLHLISKTNNYTIIEKLLEQNVLLDIQDSNLKTPIYYASETKNYNTMKILIKNNCKLNIQDINNNTPMHYICTGNYIDLIIMAYNKGGNLFNKNKENIMPIDYIYNKETPEVIEYIKNKTIFQFSNYLTENNILLDKYLIKHIINFIY